jgi:ABC-type nitrate/sulfonate/bicarbonate transport system permease component
MIVTTDRGGGSDAPKAADTQMRRARGIIVSRVVLPAAGLLVMLAIWQATIIVYHLERIVLPAPQEVIRTFFVLLSSSAFWHDVSISGWEFAAGYTIGLLLGVAVGLMIGGSSTFRLIVSPVIEGFRFVVPFAWIPLTVLWFGTSLVGKVVLVGYAVFFVMVVSTAQAVAQVDPLLSRVGMVLGMGRRQLTWNVHLRAAAPLIASAAKAAAAVGWIAVVAAEYVGSSAGLGLMITNAAMSLATATVIAGMIVIGVIGAAISAVIGWLSRMWLDYS